MICGSSADSLALSLHLALDLDHLSRSSSMWISLAPGSRLALDLDHLSHSGSMWILFALGSHLALDLDQLSPTILVQCRLHVPLVRIWLWIWISSAAPVQCGFRLPLVHV